MAGHLLRAAAGRGRRTGWWEAPLFAAEQRATLVNVKLKLPKDRALDGAVSRERHLRSAHHLLDLVSTRPGHRISCPDLLADKSVHRLFGSADAALAFLRRYRTLLALSSRRADGGGGGVSLTDAALDLRHRELGCLDASEPDLLARLRLLLMLTLPRSLPLHTVDLLRWDLGLPRDYRASILRRYPNHERVWGSASSPGTTVWLSLSSRRRVRPALTATLIASHFRSASPGVLASGASVSTGLIRLLRET